MLKPMCSAKIDKARFLRAMRLPRVSQNRSSSGSQWSIHRPRRLALAVASETAGTPVVSMVVLMAGDATRARCPRRGPVVSVR
jgi:hypothetical protein